MEIKKKTPDSTFASAIVRRVLKIGFFFGRIDKRSVHAAEGTGGFFLNMVYNDSLQGKQFGSAVIQKKCCLLILAFVWAFTQPPDR